MSRPVLGAAALIGIMSLLRAYAAFNFPLTPDEAYYWTWSLHPSLGYTDHPPMVAWLIALGSFLGHSYGAVRLPFIVAEALAAIALGMAAKNASGDARAGAFAAIVFTLIPETKLEFAEALPDVGYVLAWSLALWAAAVLARRSSPRTVIALGAALAACVYSRTFGWALVFGVLGWAVAARRDLLRPVAAACALAVAAYVPYLVWNAANGWETFAFEFVHRQAIGARSFSPLVDIITLRSLLYCVAIVGLTWLVALWRKPRLELVAWTAIPLPLALFALSFVVRTESYWILGQLASLSIGCGIALARVSIGWRAGVFGVLGISTAISAATAVFLALPESVQAAAFAAKPALQAQFASGVYAYRPLADDLRADPAAGIAVYTDLYETSSQLLWYGVPSNIVGPSAQVPQWARWYGPAAVPQHAELVTVPTAFGVLNGLDAAVRTAYRSVGTPKMLEYHYAGRVEATFYVTRLDDPLPQRENRVARHLARARRRQRYTTLLRRTCADARRSLPVAGHARGRGRDVCSVRECQRSAQFAASSPK